MVHSYKFLHYSTFVCFGIYKKTLTTKQKLINVLRPFFSTFLLCKTLLGQLCYFHCEF